MSTREERKKLRRDDGTISPKRHPSDTGIAPAVFLTNRPGFVLASNPGQIHYTGGNPERPLALEQKRITNPGLAIFKSAVIAVEFQSNKSWTNPIPPSRAGFVVNAVVAFQRHLNRAKRPIPPIEVLVVQGVVYFRGRLETLILNKYEAFYRALARKRVAPLTFPERVRRQIPFTQQFFDNDKRQEELPLASQQSEGADQIKQTAENLKATLQAFLSQQAGPSSSVQPEVLGLLKQAFSDSCNAAAYLNRVESSVSEAYKALSGGRDIKKDCERK